MMIRSKLFLAMILIVFNFSCVQLQEVSDLPPVPLVVATVEVEYDNDNIILMVRDFIFKQDMQNPYYHYYTYLIFSENTESNYEHRFAAANAFMCEFKDTSESKKLDLEFEELAVFYAPVDYNIDDQMPRNSDSGEDLLDFYNYQLAQVLVNSIERVTGQLTLSVGLISYPKPITSNEIISEEALSIINLSDMPPAQVSNIIRRFRNAITGTYKIKTVEVPYRSEKLQVPVLEDITNEGWATKMRGVFDSLGQLASLATGPAEAEPFVCK